MDLSNTLFCLTLALSLPPFLAYFYLLHVRKMKLGCWTLIDCLILPVAAGMVSIISLLLDQEHHTHSAFELMVLMLLTITAGVLLVNNCLAKPVFKGTYERFPGDKNPQSFEIQARSWTEGHALAHAQFKEIYENKGTTMTTFELT